MEGIVAILFETLILVIALFHRGLKSVLISFLWELLSIKSQVWIFVNTRIVTISILTKQ